jgi:hypothetical protein
MSLEEIVDSLDRIDPSITRFLLEAISIPKKTELIRLAVQDGYQINTDEPEYSDRYTRFTIELYRLELGVPASALTSKQIFLLELTYSYLTIISSSITPCKSLEELTIAAGNRLHTWQTEFRQ